MGATIARAYTNEALTQSSVKLQAQSMPIFNGDTHKWQTWKKRARATIGSAGYLDVLDKDNYAERNRMKNETVFHLLQNATVEGHAAHLVDQFEPERDGRAAYQALCSWYEGDKQKNATAEDIRVKLDNNFLSTKKSASQFINEFKTYNQQLRDLGEAYTTSKVVSIFLEKITDPDYEHVVELCLAQNSTIEECIQQVRSKERRLDRNNSRARRKPLSLRRTTGSEEMDTATSLIEEDGTEYLTDNGYYSIPRHVWSKLNDAEKSKIKAHNSSLRKKRKKMDRPDDQIISHRRIESSSTDENNHESKKKARTVEFIDDDEHPNNHPHPNENMNSNITTRRNDIIKFNLKAT